MIQRSLANSLLENIPLTEADELTVVFPTNQGTSVLASDMLISMLGPSFQAALGLPAAAERHSPPNRRHATLRPHQDGWVYGREVSNTRPLILVLDWEDWPILVSQEDS